MGSKKPGGMLPTLPAIAEDLALAGLTVRLQARDPDRRYRGVRLLTAGTQGDPDYLYILQGDREPGKGTACAAVRPVTGEAEHLYCPGLEVGALLELLLELFSDYQDRERQLNDLICAGGGLAELCELGQTLLDNPVFIHDDWFIVNGMSRGVRQIVDRDQKRAFISGGALAQGIVEEFKGDEDYLHTYDAEGAQLWKGGGNGPDSLYVNLREGELFKGRLLVLQQDRPFRVRDRIVLEEMGAKAEFLLSRKTPDQQTYPGMDQMMYRLLQGDVLSPAELEKVLRPLKWEPHDDYVCIRVKNQEQTVPAIAEHALHASLFTLLPGSYVLLAKREQWVVLNVTRSAMDRGQLRHRIAPLCRDYCLYAGISSPVRGIGQLRAAKLQAGIALRQAFRTRDEKWIVPFSDCAWDYVLDNLPDGLQPIHLVSPEMLTLRRHDRQKGTQYYETFRCYLLSERDVTRTAEALIIHRTTLQYRLKKIQALIHADLEDPWNRVRLMLSLRILERMDAEQDQSPG